MENFRNLAKQYWMKNHPGAVREMKKMGIWEETLDQIASLATEALASSVRNGAQVEAAKEWVLKEIVFADPATSE